MSKKPQPRTIALDFDGVLHRYQGCRDGYLDGPILGARRAVERLMSKAVTVVVFTTRDKEVVRTWLHTHSFPPLEVTNIKRPFWLMVDDRAMPFDGVWGDDMVHKITSFQPYWLGGKPAPAEVE